MLRRDKGPLLLLYERFYVLLLVTAGAVGASFLISKGMEPVFRAQAKGFLPASQESLSLSTEAGNLPNSPKLPTASTDVQESLLGVLRSTELRVKVAGEVGLDSEFLRKNVDFDIDKFNFLVITAWDREAERGARTANSYMRVFQEHLQGLTLQDVARKREILEQSLAQTEQDLAAAEREKLEFLSAHNSVDYGSELNTMSAAIAQLRQAIQNDEVQLGTIDQRIAELRRQYEVRSEEFRESTRSQVPNPRVNSLREEIGRLETDLVRLLTELTEEHPEVRRRRASLAVLREQLATEEAAGLVLGSVGFARDSIRDGIEQQILQLETEKEGLRVQLEQHQEQLADLLEQYRLMPEFGVGLGLIERRIQQIQDTLTRTRMRLDEFKLYQARRPSFIQVTETALPAAAPQLPNIPVNLAAAALLGLILGVVFIVVAERIRFYREAAPW